MRHACKHGVPTTAITHLGGLQRAALHHLQPAAARAGQQDLHFGSTHVALPPPDLHGAQRRPFPVGRASGGSGAAKVLCRKKGQELRIGTSRSS